MNLNKIATEYTDNNYSDGSRLKDHFCKRLLTATAKATQLGNNPDVILEEMADEDGIPEAYIPKLSAFNTWVMSEYGVDLGWDVSTMNRRPAVPLDRDYDIGIRSQLTIVKTLTGAARALYGLAALGISCGKQREVKGYDSVSGCLIVGNNRKLELMPYEQEFIAELDLFAADGPMSILLNDYYKDTLDDTIDRGTVDDLIEETKEKTNQGFIPKTIAMRWRVSYCKRQGTSGYKYAAERQLLAPSAVLSFATRFKEWDDKNWISNPTYQKCIASD